MICFQFWILRSLITTNSPKESERNGCDLLSILDITIFDYNIIRVIHQATLVVICFQFWILRSLITTKFGKTDIIDLLWFAFNSGYYDLWLQLLLQLYRLQMLWFAFNSGYYDLWLQQWKRIWWWTGSCDLLSILDITIFDYNIDWLANTLSAVVICFQFWILRSLITTFFKRGWWVHQLWFAFNSGYYDLWLQQPAIIRVLQLSCDLLSILDITIFDYNNRPIIPFSTSVVICFQFWILRSLITTKH